MFFLNQATKILFSHVFFYTYIFIFGTILGSFFMLVGQRVPQKEDIVKTRSHCTSCDHTLSFFELIPLFSYIFLKGKCRSCGKKISLMYPLFELGTGILFLLTSILLLLKPETWVGLTLISLLLIITVTDITSQKIPDKILLPFFILALFERGFVQQLAPWWYMLAGSVVGFGVLFLIALLSKGGMGGGDVKLFAVLGVFLGPKYILVAFVGACVLALIYSIIKMLIQKKRSKYIPLGPFIAIVTWIVYMVVTNQFWVLEWLIKYK